MRAFKYLFRRFPMKPVVVALSGISLLAAHQQQKKQVCYTTPKKWTITPQDNSIFVESEVLSEDIEQFKKEIEEIKLESEEKQCSFVWVRLYVNKIQHLNRLVNEEGFQIHHATKQYVMLIKPRNNVQTNTSSNIQGVANSSTTSQPFRGENYRPFPSHCAGAGGIVVNANNEVLLVKEKNGRRNIAWGFPGGRVDLNGESMQDAAVREVREETGLICEPKDLLLIREMDMGLYKRPDIYFLFLLRPITDEIKLCPDEIAEFKWVQIAELDTMLKDPNVIFFPIQRFALEKLLHLNKRGYDFQKDISVKSFATSHNSSNYNLYIPTRGYL